jgi:predicted DCC family thiol-disulfide oxidoreductase YuxK
MPSLQSPVLLYDGECGLCRALVRRLARTDRGERLIFAPLQGSFAQAALRRHGLPTKDFDSLVFLPAADGEKFATRTDGVLAVLALLGPGTRFLARLARRVPAPWRDAGYRFVARVRHRVFGRADYMAAEAPGPELAGRFIP